MKVLDPVFSDIQSPHEADAIFRQDIFDEVPNRLGARRLPGPTGMQPNGHHPAPVASVGLVDESASPYFRPAALQARYAG